MSVAFEGNAFLDNSKITNTSIGNCYITTSSLDMNLANITNVKDPILDQDAATKHYVLSLISGSSEIVIDLISTALVQVSTSTSSSYTIRIDPLVLGGPSGQFNVFKPAIGIASKIIRTSIYFGGTTTGLIVTWDDTGIYVNKTDNNYDGSYTVLIS